MKGDERYAFGTRAIHAGQSPDPVTGAVMTPIYYVADLQSDLEASFAAAK